MKSLFVNLFPLVLGDLLTWQLTSLTWHMALVLRIDKKSLTKLLPTSTYQAPADCPSQTPLPQVHVQCDLPYGAPCSKVKYELLALLLHLQDDLPNLAQLCTCIQNDLLHLGTIN